MIERSIVCHLKFVEPEKSERFSKLCGNCIKTAELVATKECARPPMVSSVDMLAELEQTFRKSFGQA